MAPLLSLSFSLTLFWCTSHTIGRAPSLSDRAGGASVLFPLHTHTHTRTTVSPRSLGKGPRSFLFFPIDFSPSWRRPQQQTTATTLYAPPPPPVTRIISDNQLAELREKKVNQRSTWSATLTLAHIFITPPTHYHRKCRLASSLSVRQGQLYNPRV
jgi:hypothetical protein